MVATRHALRRVAHNSYMSTSEQREPEPRLEETSEATPFDAKLVIPREIASDVPRIYANWAQATSGQHDLVIQFGWFAVPAFKEQPAPGATIEIPVELVGVLTIPLGLVEPLIKVLSAQREVAQRAESRSGEGAVGASSEVETQ